MQINEFIDITNRVETYFAKEYSIEQRKIMFEELEYLSTERYGQLVSTVIKNCKFLPKVADFIEADREETYINHDDTKTKIECKKCNGTGYLIYTKVIRDGNREYKNQYACICSCGNAKKYEGWSISDKKNRSNFYTPIAKEIGL